MAKIWFQCCFNFLLVYTITNYNESCHGAKLERKQDFFDADTFGNKREYSLNEIGKRGFSSNLGFDYSGSSEFGIGATSVMGSDYNNGRSGGSDETLSPSRDLSPPATSSVFSSSTSPPSTRSDYPKFGRIASSSSTKDFLSSHRHRSQISRRSPHLQQTSLNNYFGDIPSSKAGSRGRSLSSATFGLVADNDGKLIGYRGSILPGYTESPSIVTSTSSLAPDSSNFVGGYFPGSPSISSDYTKHNKYSVDSSATSSGSYTSTPVYYPGREEDHTYRMRDTTSQGYEDEDSNPSLDDSDYTTGGNTYQPSPSLSSPPGGHGHHYHPRESDGLNARHLEGNRFLPYGHSNLPGPGFSYGPVGKSRSSAYNNFGTKRSFGSSNYGIHGDRVIPYSYTPLSYSDYGST